MKLSGKDIMLDGKNKSVDKNQTKSLASQAVLMVSLLVLYTPGLAYLKKLISSQ